MSDTIRTCANDRWNVSTTRSTGVEGYKLSVSIHHDRELFADGKHRWQRGEGDGIVFATSDEAWAYALEHGYTKRYSRNLTGFKQSRAARKRGYVATDFFYKMREKNLNRRAS